MVAGSLTRKRKLSHSKFLQKHNTLVNPHVDPWVGYPHFYRKE